MEKKDFKYYAFISYSHKDKKTAQKLHKRLRSYHLPSALIHSHPELPKKLGDVFLDEAALVAKEGSLTESLREYLDESNYLILICSPDSANSPYVNDEGEYFMKIGRRHHIVPLIVRGVPRSKDPNAECFVPAILDLPRELEPLGIDLKTYGERDSFLRIIATTLNLDLDNFISIEARERKRKAMIFSSMAAVIALGIGVLSWYSIYTKKLYDSSTQYFHALTYMKKDEAKAIEWFEKAAANGHIGAQVQLAAIYAKSSDHAKAAELLEKAADNVHVDVISNVKSTDAQFVLGIMHKKGLGVKQDYAKAMKWYQKAAENGNNDVQLQYELGYMYENGLGVEQDYVKAAEWYEKAAINGHLLAQYNLGYFYDEGLGVKQDYVKAAEWYEEAAINGHPEAQVFLGAMYEDGVGVKQNYVKAVEWYQKAADNGNSEAQCILGEMYENGKGITQDYATAVEWYQKAAASGNADAQCFLAGMYVLGHGVEQDYAKAAEWYQKAADNGNSTAQYFLGSMYYNGRGVEHDCAKAKKWYQKAAYNGDEDAKKKLAEMNSKPVSQDNQ